LKAVMNNHPIETADTSENVTVEDTRHVCVRAYVRMCVHMLRAVYVQAAERSDHRAVQN